MQNAAEGAWAEKRWREVRVGVSAADVVVGAVGAFYAEATAFVE